MVCITNQPKRKIQQTIREQKHRNTNGTQDFFPQIKIKLYTVYTCIYSFIMSWHKNKLYCTCSKRTTAQLLLFHIHAGRSYNIISPKKCFIMRCLHPDHCCSFFPMTSCLCINNRSLPDTQHVMGWSYCEDIHTLLVFVSKNKIKFFNLHFLQSAFQLSCITESDGTGNLLLNSQRS